MKLNYYGDGEGRRRSWKKRRLIRWTPEVRRRARASDRNRFPRYRDELDRSRIFLDATERR